MKPQTILVGICGGVAACKALDVISALRKQGHPVRVILTDAAHHFVGPAACAAVSGAPVLDTLWPPVNRGDLEDHYPHLYPALRADAFLLLPATANTLGKLAHGIADNLLTTACLSLPPACRKIFCPAMNVAMWRNSTVQANVKTLESSGWTRLGPDDGPLACGMRGEGRLRDPAPLLREIEALLDPDRPLEGKTVMILSGPTHEHLDPVRFLGNASSGKMGRAIAEAARRQGARVEFVTGPVPDAHLPAETNLHRVTDAREMLDTARSLLPHCHAVVYAAAVADFRPETRAGLKAAKHEHGKQLTLVPNPDIAATLNHEKPPGTRTIGFALQTHEQEARAREKLRTKGFDGIVLNAPENLGADQGGFLYLAADTDSFEPWGDLPKSEAAERIVQKIRLLLSE